MGLFNKICIFTSKKLENWCNGMGSYPSYHKDLIHPANHKGGVSISFFSPGMFVGWLTTTHGQSLEVHKKGHNQRVNYHFSPCLMVKSWWNWWNHHFSPLSMVKSCQIHDNPPFLDHDSHGSPLNSLPHLLGSPNVPSAGRSPHAPPQASLHVRARHPGGCWAP